MRRALALSLLALHGAFAQSTGGRPPLPAAATDSLRRLGNTELAAELFERVRESERAFLQQWNSAWHATQDARHIPFDLDRRVDLGCSLDALVMKPIYPWGADIRVRRIASANGTLGVCPNWLKPQGRDDAHRASIDDVLDPKIRTAIHKSRQELIALLDSAVALVPENNTLFGQLVRMLVDQGDIAHALIAVHNCKAYDWWCSALTGYVLARTTDLQGSETAFATAGAWLLDDDRCKWNDVGLLLDSTARPVYGALSCGDRNDLNDRFWWLSDPLWSVPGNDRLTEHYSRVVGTLLHSTTVHDELYNWSPAYGGDAIDEVIKRYGWPTLAFIGRPAPALAMDPKGPAIGTHPMDMSQRSPIPSLDRSIAPPDADRRSTIGQSNRLQIDEFYKTYQESFKNCTGTPPFEQCSGIDIGPMFLPDPPKPPPPVGTPQATSAGATFEYSLGRAHTVPAWSALQNPFMARGTDWMVSAPTDSIGRVAWWPREHYAPLHPVIQFADIQTALFRREQSPLLAFATNLGLTSLGRQVNDSVTAVLVVSANPDTMRTIATVRRASTDRLVFVAALPPRPIVASVEIPWDQAGKPAGRSRFGVTPPPTLAQMNSGDIAISDPVLMLAPSDGRALPNDAEAVSTWMLGGTTVSPGTRAIGVYWETYGFGANDTVEVSVRVERQTAHTLLERVGSALQIGNDPNVPVTTSWHEPAPGHQARTIGGTVPIQMRSVVADITSLRDGAYSLVVSVGKPGQTPVQSQRTFFIH